MRAEAVIYALLGASSGLSALIGTRLYPNKLPQNTAMPAVAYRAISGIELTPIDAQAGYQVVRTRVQITAMAKNYAEVKAILEQVRLACLYRSGSISTAVGTVRVLSVARDSVGADMRDDDLALYLQSMDLLVTHYET
ncbi:MAG: DUF3168 domain-containing protein [Rhodoferax sp.]|nr:DUF3168 domain-containing protein [Rhodoferax sp.]